MKMLRWTEESLIDAVQMSFSDFSQKYPEASFEGYDKKRRNGKNGKLSPALQLIYNQVCKPLVPEARPPKDSAPLHAPGDCLYICDTHIPLHHEKMLWRALKLAEKFEIRTIVIGGDVTNQEYASRHPKNVPYVSVHDEKELTGEVLDLLMEYSDNLYLIPGNHDVRASKKLDADDPFKTLIRGCLPDRSFKRGCTLHISDTHYLYIGNTWMAGHPDKYSGLGGKTPASIALRVHKNVLAAHNHVVGCMQSDDGLFLGVDPGHMTDQKYHTYLSRSMPGQYASWTAGFCILKNEKPYMFNDLTTDWKYWGIR